jgi:hypothetical protein
VLLAAAATVTAGVLLHPRASGSTPVAATHPAGVTHSSSPSPSPSATASLAGSATTSRPAPPADAFTPCGHNHRSQFVAVSIRRQHAWACAGERTVLSTPVTTGAAGRSGDATPKGTFAVEGLTRNTTLDTSADGPYRVRFWIPFHLGVWGFHDAAWQRIPFGSRQYVKHGSHGCVHLPLAAMKRLFRWVHYGTKVRIT